MSTEDLLRMFEEAENTAEYQFEKAVVDLTEQICEIMEAQGISRADLARRLGKSRPWVTKVLRGDRNLTLKTITDILWELGYRARIEAEPRQAAEEPHRLAEPPSDTSRLPSRRLGSSNRRTVRRRNPAGQSSR